MNPVTICEFDGYGITFLVPKVGLEPTRPCGHWILNPARLPFRHFGTMLPAARQIAAPYKRHSSSHSALHGPSSSA